MAVARRQPPARSTPGRAERGRDAQECLAIDVGAGRSDCRTSRTRCPRTRDPTSRQPPNLPDFHTTDSGDGGDPLAEGVSAGEYTARAADQGAVPLRPWQCDALAQFEASGSPNFLAVATPGAGKTTFALTAGRRALVSKAIRRVVVVVPTQHLKYQWAQAAERLDIHLDPEWSIGYGGLPSDAHGVVVTYQQVAAGPAAFRPMVRQALVVLDEIHHAGDSRSWGDAIRQAFDPAWRRLSLSGTPFRSDQRTIPFINYVGELAQPDFEYGYGDALAGPPGRAAGLLSAHQRADGVDRARRRLLRGDLRRSTGARTGQPAAAHRPRRRRRLDAQRARAGPRPADAPARERSQGGRPGHHDRSGARQGDRRRSWRSGSASRPRSPPPTIPRPPRRSAGSPTASRPGSSRCGWSPRGSTSRGFASASTPPTR